MKRMLFGIAFIMLAALPGCDMSCNSGPPAEDRVTGGDYGPVTPEMLNGATLSHRTGRDSTYDDLTWTFGDGSFQITAGANGLPPVLAASLLPEGLEASEISGHWSVADDIITFTDISADGVDTEQEPRQLETMFTGVLRVVAGRQYVFHRNRP